MAKKIIIGVICVLLCAAGATAVYIGMKLNKIDTEKLNEENVEVNEGVPEDLGTGYTTFAIFGGDSRTGEMDKGVRSDCIIIVSLNNETKEIKMASVYRDTLLDIGDNSLQKCNAAYSYGGAEQAVNMLNKNLDLNITDYVTVDFKAVADAIDLLGGVEIDVQEEELDALNKYIKETARVAEKDAVEVESAGLQTLNGVQATTYARIRSTAGGDFVRTERQRLVIEKMVEKVKECDLPTINKIIDEVFPSIKTSFTSGDILNYAKYFLQYTLGETTGFPIEKATDQLAGKGSVVIPVTLETNVQELHEFLYGTENYQVSATVSGLSAAIDAEVGSLEAESDDSIYNRMYEDTDDDKQQEQYTAPSGSSGNSSNTGKNSGGTSESTGGSNNRGSTGGGGSSSGGSTGGDSGGGGTGGSESQETQPEDKTGTDISPGSGESSGQGNTGNTGESGGPDTTYGVSEIEKTQ